jgi:hypothetical protein
METGLFLELSEEQQELISGGGQLYELDEYDYTDFEYQTVKLDKVIGSGPKGSFIEKSFNTNFIFTSAEEYLSAYFD